MNNQLSPLHPLFAMEYVSYDNEYIMPGAHSHNSYELYILEHGGHNMLINDSIHYISKYDVVLFKPNVFHKSLKKRNCSRTCVYFTERFLHTYFTEASLKVLLGCFERDVISLSKEAFFQIKSNMMLLEKESISDADNRIFVYVADILTILSKVKDEKVGTSLSSISENFTLMLSYINENYNKIKNIEEIAQQFYISKYYLCHLFKETTGLTLIQYINNIKIQNACHMLTHTNLTISQIGELCGFSSTMYFCKCFKQTIHMTPKEFRNHH